MMAGGDELDGSSDLSSELSEPQSGPVSPDRPMTPGEPPTPRTTPQYMETGLSPAAESAAAPAAHGETEQPRRRLSVRIKIDRQQWQRRQSGDSVPTSGPSQNDDKDEPQNARRPSKRKMYEYTLEPHKNVFKEVPVVEGKRTRTKAALYGANVDTSEPASTVTKRQSLGGTSETPEKATRRQKSGVNGEVSSTAIKRQSYDTDGETPHSARKRPSAGTNGESSSTSMKRRGSEAPASREREGIAEPPTKKTKKTRLKRASFAGRDIWKGSALLDDVPSSSEDAQAGDTPTNAASPRDAPSVIDSSSADNVTSKAASRGPMAASDTPTDVSTRGVSTVDVATSGALTGSLSIGKASIGGASSGVASMGTMHSPTATTPARRPPAKSTIRKSTGSSVLASLMGYGGSGPGSRDNMPSRSAKVPPRPPTQTVRPVGNGVEAGKAARPPSNSAAHRTHLQNRPSEVGAGPSGTTATAENPGLTGKHVTAERMAELHDEELYAHANPTGLFDLLQGAELMMEFEDETRQRLEVDPFLHKHKLYRPGRTEGIWRLVERIKANEGHKTM